MTQSRPQLIFLLITFYSLTMGSPRADQNEVFLWPSSNGNFLTWVRGNQCLHVNCGGDFATWRKIVALCSGKKNLIFLSRYDRRHANLVRRFQSQLDSCLYQPSTDWLALPTELRFERCPPEPEVEIWEPDHLIAGLAPLTVSNRKKQKTIAFYLPGPRILISETPAAPQFLKMKSWLKGRKPLFWVTDFSGLKAKTSTEMLNEMVSLRSAWVFSQNGRNSPELKKFLRGRVSDLSTSADKTVNRQRKLRLPVLATDDWGTIIWRDSAAGPLTSP